MTDTPFDPLKTIKPKFDPLKTKRVVLTDNALDYQPEAAALPWHRKVAPGQLFPRGWRPLFLHEKICRNDMRKVTDDSTLADNPYTWEVYEGTIRGNYRDEIYVDGNSPLHITKRDTKHYTLKPVREVALIDLATTPPDQDLPPFPAPGEELTRPQVQRIMENLPRYAWDHTDASIGRAYNISNSTVRRYRHIFGYDVGTLKGALLAPKATQVPTPPVPPAPTPEDFLRAASVPLPGIPTSEIPTDVTPAQPSRPLVRTRKQATKERMTELAAGMEVALQDESWSDLSEFLIEYTELFNSVAPAAVPSEEELPPIHTPGSE